MQHRAIFGEIRPISECDLDAAKLPVSLNSFFLHFSIKFFCYSASISAAGGKLPSIRRGCNDRIVAMIETVDFYNRFGFFTAKEITNVQRLKRKMLAGSTPRSVLEIATREALRKAWPKA
jgi:hypothetical protein